MPLFHSVRRMTATQILKDGMQRVRAFEQADSDAEHLHELATLDFDVGAEQHSQGRIQRKQLLIKNQRGDATSRFEQGESLPDELNLLGSHDA